MPLFSRSVKPEGEEAVSAADAEAESGTRHTIGELLRETRQSYGGEIDRIASTLRIRAAYLTAIEESQYDKLPGPVYAQGFVRAYAVHLGLDGDEAIRRFKQEVEGFEVTRDLSFPVPLAERSIPGGTMLLAALILAICGYGLWYYVSTGDRTHPERVSAVPSDMAAATQPPAAPAATPAATAAAAPSTSAAPPATPTTATPAAAPATPSTPTATTPAATAPPAPTSPPPAATASASPPVSATPAAVPFVPPPVVGTPAAPATPAPQTVSAPPTDASSAPVSSTTPAQPRVFGAPPNVPARIVVHAVKDSWIQLRNGDDVMMERILHPGDTVRIPDQAGLTLRTGNGAGIAFEVDGKLGKPLSGTVRTVALDANRLASGRPIVNQPAPNRADTANRAEQDQNRAYDQAPNRPDQDQQDQ